MPSSRCLVESKRYDQTNRLRCREIPFEHYFGATRFSNGSRYTVCDVGSNG